MSAATERPGWLDHAIEWVSIAGSVGTVITLGMLAYGVVASILLWRSRAQRNKFSRVYFPVNREDFYEYYVARIRKAKKAVYITSDGFNMRNPQSRRAARLMNEAQSRAIKNGATVYRYQMTSTMHLNWLEEVCAMKRQHGEQYKTFVNPRFETIGNFAVIDPGARSAVTEFMLPDLGGLGQATVARDYGFVHGHQGKANQAKAVFDRIIDDPDSVEVTDKTVDEIRRALFEQRMERHCKDDVFHIFDEEVLFAIKRYGPVVSYEQIEFASAREDQIPKHTGQAYAQDRT